MTAKKSHFRRALEADPDRVHLAAHSHHLWPDVSFAAHAEAWLDAARLADRKWDKLFGEVLPRAQAHAARLLGLASGASIAFAPSTHELFMRILSSVPRARSAPARALRVLTTDSEFHSFARQAARLEEDGELAVTRVPTEPFASFPERFADACAKDAWDLVYVSHVFFNSGWAIPDLSRVVGAVRSADTFVVVDGYHAFCAIPVDLRAIHDRAFYLAGGYKYAMSGEGCCFVHAPDAYGARPRDTGWLASFGALAHAPSSDVAYAPGGARFLGATFDPTALYRFNAVMDWLARERLDPAQIHAHAVGLEERFVAELAREPLALTRDQLVVPMEEASRGQFLTFETPRAGDAYARLLAENVITDVRGTRIRFGFGLYADESDVDRAITRMRRVLR